MKQTSLLDFEKKAKSTNKGEPEFVESSELIRGDVDGKLSDSEYHSDESHSGNLIEEDSPVIKEKRSRQLGSKASTPTGAKRPQKGSTSDSDESPKKNKRKDNDTPDFLKNLQSTYSDDEVYGIIGEEQTNNPHSCKICGKAYQQAASLRCHMLTHTGEKPFLCEVCGKGITQKSGLKKHMLTHTGKKPHTCGICFKKFRFSNSLIIHKRGHTGEKPYVCTVCDKRFVRGEQLKRHEIVHTYSEVLDRCSVPGGQGAQEV